MKMYLRNLILFLSLFTIASPALAGDFVWSGRYRFEGVFIEKPELADNDLEKAYLQQHLTLEPHIVASDGIFIDGRIDVFNTAVGGSHYLGQALGQGPGNGSPTGTNSSNILGETQSFADFQMSQLYLTWKTDYGAFVAGRAPLQFGLGMTYDSGHSEFDHWMDTLDLVGYKFVVGNLFLMPMYGKASEGSLQQNDDVRDMIFQLGYENPDSEVGVGVFYRIRSSTGAGNDAPAANLGGSVTGGWNSRHINFFFENKKGNHRFGAEAGLNSGSTGVTVSGSEVSIESHGLVFEWLWDPREGESYGVNLGYASGDDPGTTAVYEGFHFDRNYDVAMLLFNHPLGEGDFLRNALVRDTSVTASNHLDDETISNTFFVSPHGRWQWSKNWFFKTQLTYANLNRSLGGGDTDLGLELDLALEYQPHERIRWKLEAAQLFSGSAFKGGSNNFSGSSTYGIMTKAAVTF